MARAVREIGDALVDRGSSMANGVVLHADGSTSDDAGGFAHALPGDLVDGWPVIFQIHAGGVG